MKRPRPDNQATSTDGSNQTVAGELAAQSLCQACGLCCDATMFGYVLLKAEEELAHIDEANKILFGDGQAGIVQPCRFYRKRLCSIYHLRPRSCMTFRCQLLRRYAHDEVSKEQALEEISDTLRRIDRVKGKMQDQVGRPIRNLTQLFKAWTSLQGGCYAAWSSEHEAMLREYRHLLTRLRQTFGESSAITVSTKPLPRACI